MPNSLKVQPIQNVEITSKSRSSAGVSVGNPSNLAQTELQRQTSQQQASQKIDSINKLAPREYGVMAEEMMAEEATATKLVQNTTEGSKLEIRQARDKT
jgi:hypothetical protein